MGLESSSYIALPLSVVGIVDVGRLIREIEALDQFFSAASVRAPGTQPKMPRTSRVLDEVLQLNKINGLIEADRKRLLDFLQQARTQAPVLHMSFSADPSPLFMTGLMGWLRQEIHPLVMLQIGLQPTIGAGCVVRTNNKYFDFSLRERLKKNNTTLLEKLRAATIEAERPEAIMPGTEVQI